MKNRRIRFPRAVLAVFSVLLLTFSAVLPALATGGMTEDMSDGGMMSDMGDMIGDMGDKSGSTLGDLDGDGIIDNDSSRTDTSHSRTRESTEPISNSGTATNSDTAANESAMSWTAIIVALLLAAAFIAVVIALIPKKRGE